MKILHVSAHLGGGVGTVVYSWVNNDTHNTHTLAYLNDIPGNNKPGQCLFNLDMIPEHDIVVVHVWNHPALFDFLVNTPLPSCRLIGWSHMAGHHPPYILFDKLMDYFDDFYFTSPVCHSRATPDKVVWSTGDMSRFLQVDPRPSDTFTIGYVGTLDFSKLNEDFIEICSAINSPWARFIVVGSGCDIDILRKQAAEAGLNMVFTGQVPDAALFLSRFDVFLYPLARNHYGTAEQILGEALSVGIPAICLDNPAEKEIVKNFENGFLCRDKFEISEKINLIYEKKIIFDVKKIKNSAKKIYSIEKKIKRWNFVLTEAMGLPKRRRAWINDSGNEFIESLGPAGVVFQHGSQADIEKLYIANYFQWRSNSKGSINQYADYFKDNIKIQKWRQILCNVQHVDQSKQES